ncbi:UDP-N-acetylmuramate dehydrogenase [Candidatus Microgenomates bacterium]|nr:UDP-N-acetylmuramate dehydrogenase [Candidatus Microgenomates bacterium]
MFNVKNNVDLLPLNTFKISAFAKLFCEINTPNDFISLPKEENKLVLGGGANILFTKNFDGIVLKNNILGKKVINEDEKEIIIEAGSGEDWIEMVNWTTENDWSGIENLAYIPGTVGAAPVQNLAAYGQNFGENVIRVKAVMLEDFSVREFSYDECKLYYRDSIFKNELKNKVFITSVTFKLSKQPKFDTNYYGARPYESLQNELDKIARPPYTPKIIAQAVTNQRKIKMPDWKTLGTAGSIFKNPFVTKNKLVDLQSKIKDLQVYPINDMLYPNPHDPVFKRIDMVKIPAGKLLDELGWRGKRIGNIGTYEKHALVLVNYGGATGQEILDFIHQMQADVKKNFDIDLDPEVNII